LIVSFSSRGPTFDGRTKPEVCALGYGTYSADPEDDNDYIYVSGTSLSTPLIAGAAAIIVGARPNWTNMQVREAMMMTANRHDTPDNNYGWGLPDILAALDYFPPGVEDSDKEMSSTFNYLIPNYPNPFSSLTNIEYLLPTTREVNLSVYDIQGRLVQTLVSGKVSAGRHRVIWDRTDRQGYDVSSGVYFYRLSVGNHTETRQMVVFR
jgi:subtilisin family serine protease